MKLEKISLHRFENLKSKVISLRIFWKRQLVFWVYGVLLILLSLAIGVMGYMRLAHQNFIDAFYNSSLMLTGMGPVAEMPDDQSKIFAAFYSLYSGVAFLTTLGVMFVPIIHRLLHVLHVEVEDEK